MTDFLLYLWPCSALLSPLVSASNCSIPRQLFQKHISSITPLGSGLRPINVMLFHSTARWQVLFSQSDQLPTDFLWQNGSLVDSRCGKRCETAECNRKGREGYAQPWACFLISQVKRSKHELFVLFPAFHLLSQRDVTNMIIVYHSPKWSCI